MRVIDADEALQRCDNDIETMKAEIEGKVPFQVGAAMVSAAKELRNNLKEYLDKTPTLDCEPVRHGEWIMKSDDNSFGVCSCCNRSDHIDPLATRCRYCGAKMDGGKENDAP